MASLVAIAYDDMDQAEHVLGIGAASGALWGVIGLLFLVQEEVFQEALDHRGATA